MSEKFSLKWNDFQTNLKRSLSLLREDNDFSDVTIITDDRVTFKAHKILLSSCSETFNFILKECNQTQSILYLSGVNSVYLKFILDYIYHGQVNLFQEQLDSFLENAKKLEIQGLVGHINANEDSSKTEADTDLRYSQEEEKYEQPMEKQMMEINNVPMAAVRGPRGPSNDATKINVGTMSPEEIKLKIEELYEKVDGVWRCLACVYTTNNSSGSIRRHIESHIDGLSYKCTQCNKEFRSSNILTTHKIRSHK